MIYDYTALRGFIKMNFGTLSEYAKFLNISMTSLYMRLSNRQQFDQTEIFRTKKILEKSNSPFTVDALFFTPKVRKISYENKKEG